MDEFSIKHMFLVTLAAIIVISNASLVVVICYHRRLRTDVHGTFLLSIAFADLLSGFPTIPLHVAAEVSVDALMTSSSTWFCLAAMSLSAFQLLVVILTLFVHIIERYFYLAHPLIHKRFMRRSTALAIVITVWIYSVIFGALPLLGWNALNVPYNQTTPNKTASWLPVCRFDSVHRGSYLGVLFFMHLVPICIIVPVLYVHILCQAQLVLKRRTVTTSIQTRNTRRRCYSVEHSRDPQLRSERPKFRTSYSASHIESSLHRMSSSSSIDLKQNQDTVTSKNSRRLLRSISELQNSSVPCTQCTQEGQHFTQCTQHSGSLLSLSRRCDVTAPRRPHLRPFLLLFLALLLFVVSWIPTMIWHSILFQGFTKDIVTDSDFLSHPLPDTFCYAGVIFGVTNAAINPLLFGLGNTQVRRAYKRTLCSACKKKRSPYRKPTLTSRPLI